uniref:Uncharacterized protein n=1 Tax=Rhizophora mucronata TaxID=61149 RepID=A0A2P2NAB3_RHIMU
MQLNSLSFLLPKKATGLTIFALLQY